MRVLMTNSRYDAASASRPHRHVPRHRRQPPFHATTLTHPASSQQKNAQKYQRMRAGCRARRRPPADKCRPRLPGRSPPHAVEEATSRS
eukprot:364262-Chlamydomonas_euryale.AAC.14